MFIPPNPNDYGRVSHWTGCDVEQPYSLAYEAYCRDLEENELALDSMEARGGPLFGAWPDFADEILF